MSDPGFSNDWWGRDPIEQAGSTCEDDLFLLSVQENLGPEHPPGPKPVQNDPPTYDRPYPGEGEPEDDDEGTELDHVDQNPDEDDEDE